MNSDRFKYCIHCDNYIMHKNACASWDIWNKFYKDKDKRGYLSTDVYINFGIIGYCQKEDLRKLI